MGKRRKAVEYVVGYKYHLGMHMVVCHGPVDALTGINTGDHSLWRGSVGQASISVNAPELYGGKAKEGGVSGIVNVEQGGPTQAPNAYLSSVLGANVPGHRGVLGAVLNRVYLGDNPYLKPWAFRARRTNINWENAKCNISGDMNPAHIIYDCMVNRQWGMGYLPSDIDQTSFINASNTLYNEGFGLSLLWNTSISISDFLEQILQHIDAVFFLDHNTGLFVLKLLRFDYNPATLTVIGEKDIKKVVSYKRRTFSEMANTVTVKFKLHVEMDDVDDSVTAHNIAMIQKMGQIVPHQVNFPGISKPAIASRVAWRELKKISSELSSATITMKPSVGWNLKAGDVFKFSWPDYNVVEEIMRVLQVDYGTLEKGEVTVEAVQDIFSAGIALYSDPPPSAWTSIYTLPVPVAQQKVTEKTYWSMMTMLGQYDNVWEELDEESGIMEGYFAQPSGACYNYKLFVRPGTSGDFFEVGSFGFTPTALLANAINPTDTLITLSQPIDLGNVSIKSYAYIGEEIVEVENINLITNIITVKRGILDTVPVSHLADENNRVWFGGFINSSDEVENIYNSILQARACPRTDLGTLALGDAATASYTFKRRAIRPYPPGNFRFNTVRHAPFITGRLTVAWAHRDRLQQTVEFVAQSAGNIGPELGTTYEVRIYDENGVLRRTASGITVSTYDWLLNDEIAECALPGGRPNEQIRVELWSMRDGYESWQRQDYTVPECRGYGMFYGAYYGE